ncbi:MAG TPA: ATPase, T2SS/T4P/T4SS family, partial [Solirubrobacteraceae bacterium]|nr:ATPase, T2SS/T4P/T4SS family [Solirubrobacteraceae bacterium]
MGDFAMSTVPSRAGDPPDRKDTPPEKADKPDGADGPRVEQARDQVEREQTGERSSRSPAASGEDDGDRPELAGDRPELPGDRAELPGDGKERREEPRKPASSKGLYPPKHPGRSTRMIGEVVVDLGLADQESVEDAVSAARDAGRPTGVVLVERGILRHDQLARVVAERFGLDFVDLSVYDLDMGAVNLVGVKAAKRYQAVPVGFTDDGALLLAMANPTNVLTIDDIGMMTGRRIRPAAASVEDLNLLLARLANMDESIEDIVDDAVDEDSGEELSVDEADSDAPVIKLVHSIIAQAVQQGASDIHVNPEEGDTRVLFRVDGVLAPAATVKRKMAMGVVSRIKILADMDISERRVPQDGRFALTVEGRRVDIRVVTLPLVNGEGAVMRILDKAATVDELDSLGMQPREQERFVSAIRRPNGAVLVTGPTGSGKSTTLYAALNALNDGDRSILTIE